MTQAQVRRSVAATSKAHALIQAREHFLALEHMQERIDDSCGLVAAERQLWSSPFEGEIAATVDKLPIKMTKHPTLEDP